jgi:hypothetical protein
MQRSTKKRVRVGVHNKLSEDILVFDHTHDHGEWAEKELAVYVPWMWPACSSLIHFMGGGDREKVSDAYGSYGCDQAGSARALVHGGGAFLPASSWP